MMTQVITDEIEVKVSASEAWKVYGRFGLVNIILEQFPHIVQRIDIEEGDGGAGTVPKLTFPPGTPLAGSHQKDKFTVVDDEKRVKVAEVIEGGYLDQGFAVWKVRYEIIDNDEHSCITKATVEYEVKGGATANLSLASTQARMEIMKAAADYLTKNKN